MQFTTGQERGIASQSPRARYCFAIRPQGNSAVLLRNTHASFAHIRESLLSLRSLTRRGRLVDPGHQILILKITGLNPVRATKCIQQVRKTKKGPKVDSSLFFQVKSVQLLIGPVRFLLIFIYPKEVL